MASQLSLARFVQRAVRGVKRPQSRALSSLLVQSQPKLASLPHFPVIKILPTSQDDNEITAVLSMRALTRLLTMLENPSPGAGLAAPPENSCFSFTSIPGKGIGMIATTRISPGDLILSERPVLVLPQNLKASYGVDPHPVHEVWPLLSSNQREKIESLRNAFASRETLLVNPETWSKIGLISTNALNARLPVATENGKEDYAGIFPSIARCNHSPNAMYDFNPKTFSASLIATSPIEDAEEITITYIDPCLSQSARKALLLESYDFECECPACVSSDIASSDRRRMRISNFMDHLEVPSQKNEFKDDIIPYPNVALTHPSTTPSILRRVVYVADAIFRLIEEEGLHALIPSSPIYQVVERAAFASVLLGDKDVFDIWSRQASIYSRTARWMHNGKPLLSEDQWEQAFNDPEAYFATWGRNSDS
ncbi:uncharacterized protein EI90DRAFT_3129735 [Cantharellus anzutake]|uniref:uncharacterized protein n=1 Tax=Cantharellus anzutake TaxID=1750568 RepID=UPI0019074ED9|nr:uncharacterized protein EI90DRAFT_3129735 [Cantharellus anzutake]KAF8324547.1 hypothetical protein EI90DRAFT_3129735 [Cantharellus anzutake]